MIHPSQWNNWLMTTCQTLLSFTPNLSWALLQHLNMLVITLLSEKNFFKCIYCKSGWLYSHEISFSHVSAINRLAKGEADTFKGKLCHRIFIYIIYFKLESCSLTLWWSIFFLMDVKQLRSKFKHARQRAVREYCNEANAKMHDDARHRKPTENKEVRRLRILHNVTFPAYAKLYTVLTPKLTDFTVTIQLLVYTCPHETNN